MLKLFIRWLDRRRNRRHVRAQVRWGLEYIRRHYSTPQARARFARPGWYG